MRGDFPAAVPEIPVSDLNRARAYYEHSLGFAVDWVETDLGLAGVSRGQCRMFLATADFRQARGNVGPVLIWLNVNSKQEVDDLHTLWSRSGADLLSQPESKAWGLHEFTTRDVDGNLFRVFYDFGTAARGTA